MSDRKQVNRWQTIKRNVTLILSADMKSTCSGFGVFACLTTTL
nr:MAG TPA: hypothetical protein [Caudoviricetes sp.]